MFDLHKRLNLKRSIKRYNEIIKGNPVPSVDEIPYWLCEDDVFHHIFADKSNQSGDDALFNLVNGVLRNAKMNTVKRLVVKNPNLLKRRRRQKGMILDLLAEDDEGVLYDIEIQKRNRPGFWDRMFAYGDRLRAEQLNEGDEYSSLRRVVVIAFVAFPIRNDENVWFDVYRETSQYDPTYVYDGKTTIFIRVQTSEGQTPTRIEDPELAAWLRMFGYPKLTTEEDVTLLAKTFPIVKKAREKMLNFFGLFFGGGETRRVGLALADGFSEGMSQGLSQGETKATRAFIVRTLRRRFPNENENLFTTCVSKLEEKNSKELDDALDRSEVCSSAGEFVETL